MENKGHKKMNPLQRAKQFMPFAALKGYEQLVAEEGRYTEVRREMSDDQIQILRKKLAYIRKGDRINVVYYNLDYYRTVTGYVRSIEPVFQTIRLDLEMEDITIDFQDIWKIDLC